MSFIAIYCGTDNNQCHLSTWAHWAVAMGPHKHRAHANLGMFCMTCFLMFKHWFCWKYHYNKYMLISSTIYISIPVSGCVGRGPCALLFPSDNNAVKMALTTISACSIGYHIIYPFWAPYLGFLSSSSIINQNTELYFCVNI